MSKTETATLLTHSAAERRDVVQNHAGKTEESTRISEASYFGIVTTNRPFRLYLASCIVTHAGEWFTYVASIAILEMRLQSLNVQSRSAISWLAVLRMAPNVFLSPLGGMLADCCDRRLVLTILDCMGSLVPIVFLVADQTHSITLVYLATFLQAAVAALNEPCSSALVPMLVSSADEEALKKASTLAELCWSLMATVGAALGGVALGTLGIRVCFVLDSCSYLLSAILLSMIGGKWNAARPQPAEDNVRLVPPWETFRGNVVDGVQYWRSSFFGSLVFLKFSCGWLYGAKEVLNVAYAEGTEGIGSHAEMRLGLLLSFIGAGCLIGPVIGEYCTTMSNPATLQRACLVSILCAAVGNTAMGILQPFYAKAIAAGIRAAGVTVSWIHSSVLLQLFTVPDKLGRVLALDFALVQLSESLSALLAGYVMDEWGLSADQVNMFLGALGLIFFVFWTIYHVRGGGAASTSARGWRARDDRSNG